MFPIHDENSSRSFPIITTLIIVICTFVLYQEFSAPNLDEFIYKWALIPSLIDFNNINTLYPFITSIFLHAVFFHFIGNMWFLWIFGDNVEAEMGRIKYLIFFLAGGIVASLTQMYFIDDPTIPNLGASGAIAAVLGYYAVRFGNHKVLSIIPPFFIIPLPSFIFLFIWFGIQLLNGTAGFVDGSSATSDVAFWAHIGGFVFGAIIGLLFGRSKNNNYSY